MKKRHTPEQIVRKLREADTQLAAGASLPEEIARRLGVSEATFHRWRNHYGGMKAEALEGAEEGERPPEEDRRRPGGRHQHPKGGVSRGNF